MQTCDLDHETSIFEAEAVVSEADDKLKKSIIWKDMEQAHQKMTNYEFYDTVIKNRSSFNLPREHALPPIWLEHCLSCHLSFDFLLASLLTSFYGG